MATRKQSRRRSTGRRRSTSSRVRKSLSTWLGSLGLAAAAALGSFCNNADRSESPAVSPQGGTVRYTGLMQVGLPASIPSAVKDYEGFTVDFNPENHTPNYVAWELLASETTGESTRDDGKFWQDSELYGCADTKDYTGSGYDRGHMCPAADQKWSAKAMSDCFVMANMCPQAHALNAGAWSTLESKERLWAQRDSAVVIIAGPIYEGNAQKRIGSIGVRVPDGFFKVLLAPYVDEPRAIAFVYPNDRAPGNMQDYAMSVDELEEMTGYDFFASLPDDIENRIEAVASFKTWNATR